MSAAGSTACSKPRHGRCPWWLRAGRDPIASLRERAGPLRGEPEAADPCAHLLLQRSWDGHAIAPLEGVASTDERVDRHRDVQGSLGHADRLQKVAEELRQVRGHKIDRGRATTPPSTQWSIRD